MSEIAHADVGYDPSHFAVLAALEEDSFWFQTRNALIIWALRRFFGSATRILEVGVGTGFVLRAVRQAFPTAELWGSDLHVEGLRYAGARLKADAALVQVDARSMPFREHFDVVCAFDVIEHISDDVRVLDEMHRVLRGRGGIVLTVPQHAFLWSPADAAAGHARRYGVRELAAKARHAGFDVVYQTSFISLLLPVMYLSRLRSRRSGRYELAGELKVHPALNRLFRLVSAVEGGAIRCGIRFPAGGSQLLIAMRRQKVN
jgi:ubiquinone/menaquinone biosynthesis C-methylase UbiE